jgi:hypothetical protein
MTDIRNDPQNDPQNSSSQPRQSPAAPRHDSRDESEKGGHMMNEPDIGSGEKSPGEQETEEQIRQIPPRTPQAPQPNQQR